VKRPRPKGKNGHDPLWHQQHPPLLGKRRAVFETILVTMAIQKNAAENIFGKLTIRFIFSMLDLEGFQGDVELAATASKAVFLEQGKERFNQVKSFPAFAEVVQKVDEMLGGKGLESLVESTAKNSLTGLRAKSNAACIVFGHSLLDSLLYALCELSHSINPKDWTNFIKQRQVKVEELLISDVDTSVEKITRAFVQSLDRDSLLKKADMLHAVCKPVAPPKMSVHYVFSELALTDLDTLRHEIVHGTRFRDQIPAAKDHLVFARLTGIYFFSIVGEKYSLRPSLSEKDIANIMKFSV
jgi:hypothetical protein